MEKQTKLKREKTQKCVILGLAAVSILLLFVVLSKRHEAMRHHAAPTRKTVRGSIQKTKPSTNWEPKPLDPKWQSLSNNDLTLPLPDKNQRFKAFVTRNTLVMRPMLTKRDLRMVSRKSDPKDTQSYSFWFSVIARYNRLQKNGAFEEGRTLWKHEEGCEAMKEKRDMYVMLRRYLRHPAMQRCSDIYPLPEVTPETFDMTDIEECTQYFNMITYDREVDPAERWFYKDSDLEAGRGIKFLNRTGVLDEASAFGYTNTLNKCQPGANKRRVLFQRCINKPLLVNGRKFDFRVFGLIPSFKPLMMYYRDGYARVSSNKYDPDTMDRFAHLTNVAVSGQAHKNAQATQPSDNSEDEQDDMFDNESIMPIGNLIEYFRSAGIPHAASKINKVRRRMKEIMVLVVQAFRHLLGARDGSFEWAGWDFILDEDFNVYLIEINIDPGMKLNSELDHDVKPSAVDEMLDIVFEIANRKKLGMHLRPSSAADYDLIYDESVSPTFSIIDESCLSRPAII